MSDEPEKPTAARILICEDEGLIAEDIAETLRSLGYDVADPVSAGDQAVRAAVETKPDLILMDIRLAGEIDGIEAAEQIRSARDIAVVYLTGYAEKDTLERAKRTEPYGYLSKPCSLQELRSTVETALYKHTADARVKESEGRYRELVDTVSDGIIQTDTVGTVTFANPAYCRMLGFTVEEMTGKSILDFQVSESEREEMRAYLEYVTRQQPPPVPFIGRHQTKDGAVINIQSDWNYRKDGQGDVIGYVAVVKDTTEREKAEEALREREEEFRRIVENLQDPFYRADLNGVLTFLSPASERVAGYKPEEGVGNPLTLFYADPTERKKFIDLIMGNGFVNDFEARLVHKDGHIVWVSTSARLYRDRNGDIAGVEGIARDITDRKKAEEALRESEEFNRRIVDHAPFGIIYLTVDGVIAFTNPASKRIFGLPEDKPSPLLGQSIFQLPLISDQPHVTASFRELVEEGRPQSDIELAYRFPLTGKDYVLLASATPRISADGSIVGAVVMVVDITERKKAEEALRESEERYRQLAEVTFEAIAFHEGGILVDANRQFYEMSGYSREELEGKQVAPLTIAPESLGTVMSSIESGSPIPYEAIAMKKDGTRFPVEIQSRVREFKGEKLRAAAIRDVSARMEAERALRESEAKYRALVETTDTGYVILDSQGRVLDANSEYVRLTGHATLEEIMGRSVVEWTSQYDRERNSCAVQECFAKGFIRDLEIDYVDKRDGVIPIQISATVMAAEYGKRIIGLCRDVTYHKKIENRLRTSLGEKEALLKEVHHRVKNNLAVVSSLLGLQSQHAKDDYHRRMFVESQDRVRSMALAHEKLYHAEHMSAINSKDYLTSLVQHINSAAGQIGSDIQVRQELAEVDLDLETGVNLGLIVTELVSNCFKHAFPGHRAGRISLSFKEIGDSTLELSVADDGVGLPQEVQLDKPNTLGLDLVRIFSRQLRGHLEFRRDSGTEIILRFDRRQ